MAEAEDAPKKIVTPNGVREPDQVLLLGDHEDVVVKNGVIGALDRRTKKRRFLTPSHNLAAFYPNWIAYAEWATGGPEIDAMTTAFIVPAEPSNRGSQIVFLFAGLQDPNRTQIVQPVLQWGKTTYGGGAGWSVGGWFANSKGQAAVTRLTPVAAGTPLSGFVEYKGRDETGYVYEVGFSGYPASNRTLNGITALLTEAAIALESYGAGGDGDYPQSANTRFDQIAISGQHGALNPTWITQAPGGGSQRCVVAGAAVEIYYR